MKQLFRNGHTYNIPNAGGESYLEDLADFLEEINSSGNIGSGDANFVFTQAIPSAVWNITHPLNKKISITVVDSSNQVVYGGITYIDDNNVTINFNGAFSGQAYCN